jgi:hypothetical protein
MRNVKKAYAFTPPWPQAGLPRLPTRNSTRARLTNESYYRSYDRGEQANLIELRIVEDANLPKQAIFVEQNLVLKPDEMLSANFPIPTVKLYELTLDWNQEIRVKKVGGEVRAELYGIRWQIGGGETLLADLGVVLKDRMFSSPGVSFKLSAGPTDFGASDVLYLRPRTRRYTLVPLSVNEPNSMISLSGWNPNALRAAVNADPTSFVRMPVRGYQNTTPGTSTTPPVPIGPPIPGEDKQDAGSDALFLKPFGPARLRGGDGLPIAPVGIDTGPDRVLVHLNYSEKDDGSLGEYNKVFEWVGDSSSVGSWQMYA